MRFLIFLLAGCAAAQTADSTLTFEVASVKATGEAPATLAVRKNGAGAVQLSGPDPILFMRRRATLSSLLMSAYGLRTQQIVGPDWLTTERYDIQARVAEGATAAQQLVMLQNLLAERFGLKQHRETRELPVYEMVVAKGGPKLQSLGAKPLRAMQVDDPFRRGQKDGVTMIHVDGRGSLETLAARLSRVADRLILDRTGLKGDYDIDLQWSAGAAPAASPDAASDPGISLGRALGAQLGLKLEAKKDPVEVMVVDHAQKVPTEN